MRLLNVNAWLRFWASEKKSGAIIMGISFCLYEVAERQCVAAILGLLPKKGAFRNNRIVI
jgi:hypothetical protein